MQRVWQEAVSWYFVFHISARQKCCPAHHCYLHYAAPSPLPDFYEQGLTKISSATLTNTLSQEEKEAEPVSALHTGVMS